jgi:hypothetical protein
MIFSRCILTLVVAVFGSCAWMTSAYTQSAVEEEISAIDWDRATSDAETVSSTVPALDGFRAANSGELASIRLPVLVPNPAAVSANPRLRGQGNSYVVAYSLSGAKLSVLGTSVVLTRPDDQSLSQSAQGSNRVFDHSDDGSDLSFLKYGASYVLRLSCANPDDERCSKEAFLNGIADSLVVLGGRK